jgi:hypothetical protein
MTDFNLNDKEIVSNAVETNAVETTEPNDINSVALMHYRKIIKCMCLEGSYWNDVFWCVSLSAKNSPPELLGFNIKTGEWFDHAENVSGIGFVSIISYIDGYDKMEAAVVLEEFLEEIGIEYSFSNYKAGRNA